MNFARRIGFLSLLLLLAACTVVPLDKDGNLIGVGEVFDAESYVSGIWEAKVLPTFREKAVPLDELLQALQDDPQVAREKYGRQTAVGGPYTFLAAGEGKVLALEGSNLAVDLLPEDGQADLSIRIGPVFTGTEVRDGLDFINFKDFRDVTQYFAVANELNTRVRDEVVSIVEKTTVVGKTVVFVGAFGLKDKNEVVLVPVILEIR